MRYSKTADLLCELGRFGQKTGAGWYDYQPGKRDAIPSGGGRGDDRRAPPTGHHAAQDQRRRDRAALVFSLVNEGARILEEGIASKASDIDMVYLTGYGFPLHRGGPMCYADTGGPVQRGAGDEALRAQPARRRQRSGSRRRCWPSWRPKARPSPDDQAP
jgi:3-hydroxyacyl-CoA dehydrogenase